MKLRAYIFYALSLAVLVSIFGLSGCSAPSESVVLADGDSLLVGDSGQVVKVGTDTVSAPVLPPHVRDSLEFRLRYHYSKDYNFIVKADSIVLRAAVGDEMMDSAVVRRGDVIVVAATRRQQARDSLSADSFFVKVARDQKTMGWVPAEELRRLVTPNDSVSQLIDRLTNSRQVWMSVLLLLGVLGASGWSQISRTPRRKNRHKGWPGEAFRFLYSVDSIYPSLFLILTVLMAVIYASVQHFVPEFWQEFYYHPTLNPLLLPGVMAWLTSIFWLAVIAYVAIIFDIFGRLDFPRATVFLLEVSGLAMLLYLIVAWTTGIYVGYLLAALFIVELIYVYFKHIYNKTAE